jgi:hypothetical protein
MLAWKECGEISVSTLEKTEISLALPSLQAVALAHFFKRVDFETVARMSSVSVVSDGKSEADLIWLALIELRSALAAASVASRAAGPCVVPLTAAPGAGQNRASVVRLNRRAAKGGPGV